MVIHAVCEQLLIGALAVQPPAQPMLERLDPQRRVAVVMAILALVLIGLMLVGGVMIGAHWVRRMARHRPLQKRSSAVAMSGGENRRLRESLSGVLPEVDTGNTVQIDTDSAETKVDP